MTNEKAKKHCPQCETKYTVEWDIEEQDLEPLNCPFCGYEVELEDFDEDTYRKLEERLEDEDRWD